MSLSALTPPKEMPTPLRASIALAFCRLARLARVLVIVLHQILEGGFRPIAFAFRRGLAGILDLIGKTLDCLWVGLGDDLVEHCARLCLGLASDGEGIDADLDLVAIGLRLGTDVVDLLRGSPPACCRW